MATESSSTVERAQALKEEGTEFFKVGKSQDAVGKYEEALKVLDSAKDDTPTTEEDAANIKALKLTCNLNAAICHLKLENYAEAVKAADKALEIDGENVKGLYRRGVASARLGEFERAKDDLERALDKDKSNRDIRRELQAVKKSISRSNKENASGSALGADMSNIPESVLKEINEVETQHVKVSRELREIDMKIVEAERDARRSEITQAEVDKFEDTTKTYRSIGTMFLASSKSETLEALKDDRASSLKMAEDLKARKLYLERQQKSLQANIRELIQSARS